VQQAQEILLAQLKQARGCWPGADGLVVDDLLESYSRSAAAGWVPTLPELQGLHPELAVALAALVKGLNGNG
jgi:hypothetical protein